MSCGVGHRLDSDPALLWLWRRSAATALIGPLAWEPPYAMDAALKRQTGPPPKKKVIEELKNMHIAMGLFSFLQAALPTLMDFFHL